MKLELFFDYACPYCYRGHKNLLEFINKYPSVQIDWTPCEAHPRPEPMEIYSDLAIQGMYIIQEKNGDLWKYHEMVFSAMFDHSQDISDPVLLSSIAADCGVDQNDFSNILSSSKYEQQVLDNNHCAWEVKGLQAVPSYFAGDKSIGSQNGVLVSKYNLEAFIRTYCIN